MDPRSRRRGRAVIALSASSVLAGAALLAVPAQSSAATASPQDAIAIGTLLGTVSLSATDVWAVGERPRDHFHEFGALVTHWDGSSWHPRVLDTTHFSDLESVDAVTSDDVWAVGSRRPQSKDIPLIEHYDGTSWQAVETSNPPPTGDLNAVQAISADDIWAVGGAGKLALIEHWKGDKWSRVKNPVSGDLSAVSATSATDAWAVGELDRGHDGRDFEPVVEHFDGTGWQPDQSFVNPAPGNETVLSAVVANAPDDAWVFGWYALNHSGADSQMLIEHWDGTAWTLMPPPLKKGDDYFLNAAAATSSSDMWVVGQYSRSFNNRALIIHWDGSAWTKSFDARDDAQFTAVSADSPTDAWAMSTGDRSSYETHWNGTRWS